MFNDDVTGRDRMIFGQALAYMAAVLPHLPFEYQEHSNVHDAVELLKHYFRDWHRQLDQAAETVSHVEDKYAQTGE